MTAKMVAEHMKAIFSELGVPKTLVSDNGPCYIGDQFKKTMSHLGIMHITTSPHHHQSNGLAVGYVKIVKNLLSKAKETGQDYHEVISIYRSTPLSNDLPSPFELLHGRKPSIDLPQWERKPKVNLEVLRQQNKNEQAQHDNILRVGSHVMFITPPEKDGILPLFKNIWAIGHIKSKHQMELCITKAGCTSSHMSHKAHQGRYKPSFLS